MKTSILLFVLFSVLNVHAQEITKIVLVGPDGVTDNIKKAKSFIVIKQYPEYFERLDYKKGGPLFKRRSYKDSSLTILNGNYYEYRPDGSILYSGEYKDNKKIDYWRTYDDSGNVVHSAKYEDDIIIETVDVNKKDTSKEYKDEREAEFPGGNQAWSKYIIKSLENSETARNITKGGKVIISFMVGVNGLVQNEYLIKSAEFALDEDSLEIIRKSPKWTAAWQNGHPANSHKRQPITYSVRE